MDQYGKCEKKFVFYDTDHIHAKLRVKFIEDGIKQKTFFREIVRAYIEGDPLIVEWIERNPQCHLSKRSMTIRKRERRLVKSQEKALNLDQVEVDELFDILADEFGD